MTSHPHNTAATDGAASDELQRTLQVPQVYHEPHDIVFRLPASAASPASTLSPAPSAYAELGSLSEKSEATCLAHGAGMAKASAEGNVVRFIAVPNYKNVQLYHMECIVRHSDTQECLLHREDDSQEISTMVDALRDYAEYIESIQFDATSLPGPAAGATYARPAVLPFPPPPAASVMSRAEPQTRPGTMPFLPALRDVSITAIREVSLPSLLAFLHYCPMLRSLAVHSNRKSSYQAILQGSLEGVTAPCLPLLQELTMDGLLPHTVQMLLDKLLHSLNESTKLEAHFYDTGYPALKRSPGLHKLLLPIRHANVFYACLVGDNNRSKSQNVAPVAGESDGVGSTSRDPEADEPTVGHVEGLTPATGISEVALATIDAEGTHPTADTAIAVPQSGDPCVFSFADPSSRVQLHWHWAPTRGAPPNLGHVGLVAACVQDVQSLSFHLSNVHPSYADIYQVVQSCHALKRVEVYATYDAIHGSLSDAPVLVSSETGRLEAAAAATTTLTTGHTELTLDDEGSESRTDTFTSRYRLYTLRRGAGPVLRFLTDMPLLLSMALAQTPRTGLGLARGEQRPQAASAEAEEQYGYGLPPRMRWPMRLYYEPLWALLVRTSQKWKPWAWA